MEYHEKSEKGWEDSNQKRNRLQKELRESTTRFLAAFKIAEQDNLTFLKLNEKINFLRTQISTLETQEEGLKIESGEIDGKSPSEILLSENPDKYELLLDVRGKLMELYTQYESLFDEIIGMSGDLEGSQAIFNAEDIKLHDIIRQLKELDSWKGL